MPAARFSHLRVGEQTQLIKSGQQSTKHLGTKGLFHMHSATNTGAVGAQCRREGQDAQPKWTISEEALVLWGAEGQGNTVRGQGRSGSAVLLYQLSGVPDGPGVLICREKDFWYKLCDIRKGMKGAFMGHILPLNVHLYVSARVSGRWHCN